MYNCEKNFQLLEDPIFIPITQLETDEEFPLILKDMREGNTDMKVIEQKDKSTKVGKVLHRYILSTVLIVYAG